MRYLITGGAGFIGGHLAELLVARGDEVVVVDDLSTGRRGNLRRLEGNPRFTFVEDNIITCRELPELVAASDRVFHLAAAVGVDLVVRDPVRTITTNIHGTERILKAAAARGVRTLITSTSEVYGKSEHQVFSETDDLLIGEPHNSRWSYACSKLLDEFFAIAYWRQFNLPAIVVRLFNTVGPRQTGQYGMVVPRFVASALAGEPLRVFGDGEQSRCFCHVGDTVRALAGLIEHERSPGGVFNIGGTTPISIKDLAVKVVERAKSASPITMIPYEQAYAEGFEDMRRRVPDVAKINSLIGWKPELPLETIIDDVIADQSLSSGPKTT